MTKNSKKQHRTMTSAAVVFLCALFLTASAVAMDKDPTPASGRTYEFRVITYNVCGLPETITQDRGLAPIKKRYPYIGKKLRKYDVIGLQENFVKERRLIEEKLGQYFVAHGTDTMGYKKLSSGVYSFVKWPISKSLFEEWEKAKGVDALSHKGLVALTTNVSPGLSIDVYNLHAQAGRKYDDAKRMQYAQLFRVMDYFSKGQKRPIILLGDFNCSSLYDEFMALVAKEGFTHASPGLKGVDHVFFNPNGSGWKITAMESKRSFTKPVKGRLLSDHFAFETILRFEK